LPSTVWPPSAATTATASEAVRHGAGPRSVGSKDAAAWLQDRTCAAAANASSRKDRYEDDDQTPPLPPPSALAAQAAAHSEGTATEGRGGLLPGAPRLPGVPGRHRRLRQSPAELADRQQHQRLQGLRPVHRPRGGPRASGGLFLSARRHRDLPEAS